MPYRLSASFGFLLYWLVLFLSCMLQIPREMICGYYPLAFKKYQYKYVHDVFRKNNYSMHHKWKSNDTLFSPISYTMKQNVLWNNHSVCVNDTFIVIYYNVYKHDEDRRNIIREYMPQGMIVDGMRVNYFFTVVSPISDTLTIEKLKHENSVYGDIIVSLHEDNRRLIPITVLDTFLWIRDYCKTAKYVVKTDGDTWVHLGNLVHYFKSLHESHVFSGVLRHLKAGKRINYHEVYTIPYDYPEELDFVAGGGYVLSHDLIPYVNIGAQYVDVLFPASEDIIITSIMFRAGVKVHSPPKELILYYPCSKGHSFPNNVIFAHNIKPIDAYKEVFRDRSKEFYLPSVL